MGTGSCRGIANADKEHPAVTKAFAVDGSTEAAICVGYCMLSNWDTTANSHTSSSQLFEGSYMMPVVRETGLPKLPSRESLKSET